MKPSPELDRLNLQFTETLAALKTATLPVADALLTLSKTVYTASTTLSNTDYRYFCRRNKLTNNRLADYHRVGKVERTLRRYAAHLPGTLSSLVRIARMSDAALSAYVSEGKLHNTMTIEDVRLLAPGRGTRKSTPTPRQKERIPEYWIALEWYTAAFTPQRARSVLRTLQTFISKHGVDLGLMPDVKLSHDVALAIAEAERAA